jgi:ketosteroid isomerase-like protein
MQEKLTTRGYAEAVLTSMNTRDLSGLDQYLSENAVMDFPGTALLTGRKRILLFLKILFRKYPRLVFTVDEIIVEGDRACAVWVNEGEDSKQNPYHNRGITLVRVRAGQITLISDYFKDTSFVNPD